MIAPDKRKHLIAGTLAAMYGTLAYALCALLLACFDVNLTRFALIPVPFLSALQAGLDKESADWLDNRTDPGPDRHTVEAGDVVATAAPGLVLSLITAALLIL